MKKSERIKLANKVWAEMKELDLKLEKKGNFLSLSPPSKISPSLITDFIGCDKDRLMELANIKKY